MVYDLSEIEKAETGKSGDAALYVFLILLGAAVLLFMAIFFYILSKFKIKSRIFY
jgi:hypothetical protein